VGRDRVGRLEIYLPSGRVDPLGRIAPFRVRGHRRLEESRKFGDLIVDPGPDYVPAGLGVHLGQRRLVGGKREVPACRGSE